ncbi:MAG: hypothetical protein KDM81_14325, partial [Verrucomicrobiae bacterium]|nr:hypothetical protein [Verrucomicrobiae bacterium]
THLSTADFSVNAAQDRLTLGAGVDRTRAQLLVVTYTSLGETHTEKFNLEAGDTGALQLGNNVNGAGDIVSVVTVRALGATEFAVVGNRLNLAAPVRRATDLSVNYALEPKAYLGGEQVYRVEEVVLNGEVTYVLTPETFAPEATVFTANDLLQARVAARDPFGQEIAYEAEVLRGQFGGDTAIHYRGELVRYLGGEPVLDEAGRPVLNFDGSLFVHQAGQVKIYDRRLPLYVPGYVTQTFSAADLTQSADASRRTIDLGTVFIARPDDGPAITVTPDFNRVQPAADEVIAIIVTSDKGIFTLTVPPSEYAGDHAITLAPLAPDMVQGTVSIEVTLAILDYHEAGDPVRYFGDEVLAVNNPVWDVAGNFTYDEFGRLVLHDATTITRLRPDGLGGEVSVPLYHGRGELVFDPVWRTLAGLDPAGVTDDALVIDLDALFAGERLNLSSSLTERLADQLARIRLVSDDMVLELMPEDYALDIINEGTPEAPDYRHVVTLDPVDATGLGGQVSIEVLVLIQRVYETRAPRLSLGNEPYVYFGGEQIYYSAADEVQGTRPVQRVSFVGSTNDIIFSNATMLPGDVPTPLNSDRLNITLGSLDNRFTIIA